MIRSRQAAASGRPAPRNAPIGAVLVITAIASKRSSRDEVGALRHQVRRPDGERAAETGVGAALAQHPHPQPDDRAVAGQPELGVLHLAPALHREHRLAAGLGPLHGRGGAGRPAATARGRARAGLAAERAADVRRDDADLVVGRARDRRRAGRAPGAGAGCDDQAVSPSPVGSTRTALPSIGAVAIRWLTIRTRTTWSAPSRVGGPCRDAGRPRWSRGPRTAGARRRPRRPPCR